MLGIMNQLPRMGKFSSCRDLSIPALKAPASLPALSRYRIPRLRQTPTMLADHSPQFLLKYRQHAALLKPPHKVQRRLPHFLIRGTGLLKWGRCQRRNGHVLGRRCRKYARAPEHFIENLPEPGGAGRQDLPTGRLRRRRGKGRTAGGRAGLRDVGFLEVVRGFHHAAFGVGEVLLVLRPRPDAGRPQLTSRGVTARPGHDRRQHE